MVRDVELKPQDYLQVVINEFPKETDSFTGETVIRDLPAVLYYLPQTTEEEKKARSEQVLRLEHLLWSKAQAAVAGSDWQRLAVEAYVDIAESPEARDRLIGMLAGSVHLKRFQLDVDQRWAMIIHLASLGEPRVDAILEAQTKADPSDRGIKMLWPRTRQSRMRRKNAFG